MSSSGNSLNDCEHVETCVGPVRSFLKSLRGNSNINNNNNNSSDGSLLKCEDCGFQGSSLWLCLYPNCLAILCSQIPSSDGDYGNKEEDHSLSHYEENSSHALQLNLRSRKTWCFDCEREVQNVLGPPRCSRSAPPMEEPSSSSSDGLVGLANLGNTCYMNAALQCLSNTPSLTEYFISCFYPTSPSSGLNSRPLSKAYACLMHDIWTKKRSSYVVPSGVVRSIKAAHPIFQGYLQQDSQEFLRCFMDTLHEELCEPGEVFEEDEEELLRPPSEESLHSAEGGGSASEIGDYETADSGLSEDSNPPDDEDGRSSKNVLLPYNSPSHGPRVKKRKKVYRSIISDIFDGKLISTVQCLTCNRISTTEETFQDLSLPIPNQESISSSSGGNSPSSSNGWLSWLWSYFVGFVYGPKVSLTDCLSYFFSADELKGDNMYSCERCKKLRNGLKYSQVTILPDTLCIHLKRFRHEFAYSSKISSKVSFPLVDLDVSPWIHKDFSAKETVYELSGVIVHSGTASGGHYIAYCLNQLDQEWYEYDDSVVSRVDASFVLGLEAYVLFYRKSNDTMDTIRDQIQNTLIRSQQSSSLMQFYVSKEWFNRFETFAEPGPIEHSSFLCVHGGVHPHKYGFVSDITIPLPQIVWEKLHKTFGGAAPVTRLAECASCKAEQLSLMRQKAYESNEFKRLYTEFTEKKNGGEAVYFLSSSWYRKWEDFVQGRVTDPPGPINNKSLTSIRNGGVLTYSPSSDDLTVSPCIWNFFLSNYGGGPEISHSPGGYVINTNTSSSSIVPSRPAPLHQRSLSSETASSEPY